MVGQDENLSSELNFKYYINGSEQQQQNSLITNAHICTARLEKFKITHSTDVIYRDPPAPVDLWGSLQRESLPGRSGIWSVT